MICQIIFSPELPIWAYGHKGILPYMYRGFAISVVDIFSAIFRLNQDLSSVSGGGNRREGLGKTASPMGAMAIRS